MKNSDENRHQGLPACYIELVEGAEGAARAAPADGKRSAAAGAAGEATRHPAMAGGRREAPALDLSLGHFGTPIGDRVDGLVVDCGDFMLQIDHRVKTITVKVDPDEIALMDRSARRSLKRRAMKAVEKTAAVLGFTLEGVCQ